MGFCTCQHAQSSLGVHTLHRTVLTLHKAAQSTGNSAALDSLFGEHQFCNGSLNLCRAPRFCRTQCKAVRQGWGPCRQNNQPTESAPTCLPQHAHPFFYARYSMHTKSPAGRSAQPGACCADLTTFSLQVLPVQIGAGSYSAHACRT